jgi:hypothetical protein
MSQKKEDRNAPTPAPSVNLKLILDMFNAASPEDRRSLQQALSPPPAVSSPSPPPAPMSDLQKNQTIIATILQTPVAQIVAFFPDLSSTHRWYDGISALIGHLPQYPLPAF